MLSVVEDDRRQDAALGARILHPSPERLDPAVERAPERRMFGHRVPVAPMDARLLEVHP